MDHQYIHSGIIQQQWLNEELNNMYRLIFRGASMVITMFPVWKDCQLLGVLNHSSCYYLNPYKMK